MGSTPPPPFTKCVKKHQIWYPGASLKEGLNFFLVRASGRGAEALPSVQRNREGGIDLKGEGESLALACPSWKNKH